MSANTSPDLKITTGQELREARQAAGLSAGQLAELLRLSPDNGANHVRRVERGKAALTGPMAIAAEHVLLCPKENTPG